MVLTHIIFKPFISPPNHQVDHVACPWILRQKKWYNFTYFNFAEHSRPSIVTITCASIKRIGILWISMETTIRTTTFSKQNIYNKLPTFFESETINFAISFKKIFCISNFDLKISDSWHPDMCEYCFEKCYTLKFSEDWITKK